MKKSKMSTKDLILAGAFLALYLVASMVVIFAFGFVPITWIFVPIITPLLMGPFFCLYTAKVPRCGAVLLLSLIVGLLANSTGYIYGIITAVVLAIVAELLARAGQYKSKKMYTLSYMFFSVAYSTPFLMLFLSKDVFLETTLSIAGPEFITALEPLIPMWLFPAQVVGALITAFLGALLGQKLMKKHFEKANII